MADVFLNYLHEDRPTGFKLRRALQALGWSVWTWEDLPSAERLMRRHLLGEELKSASAVIILWSKASSTAAIICDAAEIARQRGVLLDVSVEDVGEPCRSDLINWTGDVAHLTILELHLAIQELTALQSARTARQETSGQFIQPHTSAHHVQTAFPADTRVLRAVFLCYRRDDTQDAAGRLHDRLVGAYGADRAYMDIDSVPLGIDFVDHVTQHISRCSAVIVMIGRQWLRIKDRGRRRLDNPDDLVRAEIAAALKQGVPVIPVLVQNASMPRPNELPEDIRLLARRNGIELSATRWKSDVERLIKELDRVMNTSIGS